MKIVILDHPRENPEEIHWEEFQKYGEVVKYPRTLPGQVAERIGDADVIFLNKTVVTKEDMEKCPNLKFVSVIATGYDTVDIEGAKELGIPVSNVPSYGVKAIGQHAIALLLEITNHVGYHDREVRKGRKGDANDWCFWDYPSIELEHKTIGIIGLGRIGQTTARVAEAFGMKVLAYDAIENHALENENLKYTDLETLLKNSDVIALHCPLFSETENLINAKTIAKMKDGVIIINNSRGGLIVEEDLAEALNSGKVYAAGLDTVRNEPISEDNPLLHAKNCYISPHISWAALECRQRLVDYSLDNLKAFMEGNPKNVVNGERGSKHMNKLSIFDFGAEEGGTLCTDAIQKAIDACYLQGGGIVEIPRGRFLTGGIRLRSNVTLYLQRDACLIGSRNPEDYMGFLRDELEPLKESEKTEEIWMPVKERKSHDFSRIPGGRWSNGLIRAINAHNIAIIGEENAVIDGMDCYDARGEERYRGPHAISFHGCENITLSGYTVRNSANWAHALFSCKGIQMSHVTVLAGHDGVHLTTCDHTRITECSFFTGDDCVAGIDNIDLAVSDCEMNTACSAFRLGGTDILIQRCHMFGPARYLFRGSLSPEEKAECIPSKTRQETEGTGKYRYNMLSAYTYYADFSREIRKQPGKIVLKDCSVEQADRLLHYNFSGNEPWQRNRPLKDISLRGISAVGVRRPLVAYGDEHEKLVLEMTDCDVRFQENIAIDSFMQTCNYEKITLREVRITNLKGSPCLLTWSEGEVFLDKVDADGQNLLNEDGIIKEADRPFACKSI